MVDTRDPADGRITVDRDGHLLLMKVDRPAKLNGFTPVMFHDLAAAYTALEEEQDLRVGVLYPEGPHFSAGLDLPKFQPIMQRGEPITPAGLIDPFDLRAPRRTKPVVMAVRGITFTLGVELAMAADIVVAGSDARMNQIEVLRGVMATGGATVRFVQRAGWGNAMRWLLTGEEFTAAQALAMKIVTEVTEPEAAVGAAIDIARRVAVAAPQAVMQTRRNALLALEGDQAAAIAAFDGINQHLSQTSDADEGVASFREKRPPRFTGR